MAASAAYPYPFGHRVARLHTEFMASASELDSKSNLKALLDLGFQDIPDRLPVLCWVSG